MKSQHIALCVQQVHRLSEFRKRLLHYLQILYVRLELPNFLFVRQARFSVSSLLILGESQHLLQLVETHLRDFLLLLAFVYLDIDVDLALGR